MYYIEINDNVMSTITPVSINGNQVVGNDILMNFNDNFSHLMKKHKQK